VKDFKVPERAAASAAGRAGGAAAASAGGAAAPHGAAVPEAGGAKSTTAKLIETMPTPADQCAPAPAGRLHARGILSTGFIVPGTGLCNAVMTCSYRYR